MNTHIEQKDESELLAKYLDEGSAKSRKHANENDFLATSCYFIAILGSFLATSATSLGFSTSHASLVAAVPALALLTNSVFAFEKKSIWHRQRRLAYRTLWMRMVYENEAISSVSKAMREFEERIALEYPRFGNIADKNKAL